jgi:hypothetical protein
MTATRFKAVDAFADDLLAKGRVSFPLAEATRATGLSVVAARNQILRSRGRFVRVAPKQQFLLVVTPEHRSMGAPPAEWWLDEYFNWLGHPYYVALLSAAAIHGSQPQALQTLQVMTDAPRRTVEIGRIRIRFFVKSAIASTPAQWVARARAPLRVSTPEATVLDLVNYADRIGGRERVVETMRPMLKGLLVRNLRNVLLEARSTEAPRLASAFAEAGNAGLARSVRRFAG